MMLKILVDGQELRSAQGWVWEAREAVITSGCGVARVGFSKDRPPPIVAGTEMKFVDKKEPHLAGPQRAVSAQELNLVMNLRTIAQMELAHLAWVEFHY